MESLITIGEELIMNESCPLCLRNSLKAILELYVHCNQCDLISLQPEKRLLPDFEKQRYLLHQGQNPEGLIKFLEPAISYTLQNRTQQDQILDYGCGADQVLVKHLTSLGFNILGYDPFFYQQALQDLAQKFDLVIATEVVEHFFNPRTELLRLQELLKPSGKLLIMTSFHQGLAHFETWSYRRDPTHVSFYSLKSFEWVARHMGFVIETLQQPNFIVLGSRQSTVSENELLPQSFPQS